MAVIMLERNDVARNATFRIIRKHHSYKIQKEVKFWIFTFWITIKMFIGYDSESGDFARLQAFELMDNLIPLEDNTKWHLLK